jgi:hypothetical protein
MRKQTLSKTDPFYNIVMNAPTLPKGFIYLRNKYKKLAEISLNKDILKNHVFKEVESGKCDFEDAKVFCDVYLK